MILIQNEKEEVNDDEKRIGCDDCAMKKSEQYKDVISTCVSCNFILASFYFPSRARLSVYTTIAYQVNEG